MNDPPPCGEGGEQREPGWGGTEFYWTAPPQPFPTRGRGKQENTMPKTDIAKLPVDTGTAYPPPLDRVVEGRIRKRLGNTDAGMRYTRKNGEPHT